MSRVSDRTKRAVGVGTVAVVLVLVVVLSLGASSGGGGPYLVRAVFDNASFVVPGEDVKVAGVKVGAVQSLDVTADRKAAIVLRVDDPAFQDFKLDASCTIRLQSLIGEKFVACEPTQPHDANAPPQPSLRKITRGPGKGQFYLPVTNTSSPVDVDLLNDIMRLPERQRFAIILNELGVGLSGNGAELRAVVRRADPALAQFDKVLAILASQNRVLANLATESDAALGPVARQSAALTDFVDKSGQTALATAQRGDAFEQSFAKLPAFLEQLTPTVRTLGDFAANGTPVFANLRAAAPSVNRIFEQLGPFSSAALPTFRTLGDLSDAGSKALPRAQPIIRDIGTFGKAAQPFARNLAGVLGSLQQQHGITNLLNVILFLTGATNGFDQAGHYLRSFLNVEAQCVTYATSTNGSCSANLRDSDASTSKFASTAGSATAADVAAPAPVVPTPPALPARSSASAPASTRATAPTGLLSYLLGNGGAR